MMAAPRMGRVLHEDDDYVVMEVAKRNDHERTLTDGDRIVFVVFVGRDPDTSDPWAVVDPWPPSRIDDHPSTYNEPPD